MSPKRTAAPKPAPPWRRETAGTYRSSDDRFELEGDGAGRWFVRDSDAPDELGLPRTTGPFATLAAAKAAADEQRGAGGIASPLAERLAAARSKPPTSGSDADVRGRGSGRTPSPRPKASTPAPPPPTWLEELEAADPAGAREARALIAALEANGVDDADDLVRRDRRGGEPVVAERLLDLGLRARVADVLTTLPGASEHNAAVAAAVMAAVLDLLEHGEGRPPLPGWELVERGSGRRLRTGPDRRRP